MTEYQSVMTVLSVVGLLISIVRLVRMYGPTQGWLTWSFFGKFQIGGLNVMAQVKITRS